MLTLLINSFSRFIVIGLILLVTSACSQAQIETVAAGNHKESAPIKISLLGNHNKLLASTSNQQKTQQIIAIVNSRKPLLEKYLPIFKMQLIIEKEQGKEVWLFAKPGYLQQKSTENNQVFYIDKNNKLLKILLTDTKQ